MNLASLQILSSLNLYGHFEGEEKEADALCFPTPDFRNVKNMHN